MDTSRSAPNESEAEQVIDTVPLYANPRVMAPVVVILLLAAGAALYWLIGMRNFVNTDDAYVDANRVAVSSKLLGRVEKLSVDEGENVKAGQVLVQLDDSDLKALREQAQANLQLAKTNVTLAQVQMDKADQDLKRVEMQFRQSATSAENYDHARMDSAAAHARFATANAQVAMAQAQLNVADTTLKNTTIFAPMDGVVAKRWVLAGDVVQPGQPVFTIYDINNIWVTANLEETNMAEVRLNNPVEIEVDTYAGRHFAGKVFELGTFTAGQFSLIPPNNASGNFTKVTQRVPVKISVAAAEKKDDVHLLPGMSVEVRIKVR